MQKLLLVALLCVFSIAVAFSQERVAGEFLVQWSKDSQTAWAQIREEGMQAGFDFAVLDSPAADSRIYLLRQYNSARSDEETLSFLRRQSSASLAQYNHLLQARNTSPNDPQFSQQWQYINNGSSGGALNMDLDADLAWDITTGGLTNLGDTIVIAIIDNGVNTAHPDLIDNLWVNRAETPNNQIDDDGNGYVDDYLGWNVLSQNDNIASSGGGSHGTPVAGIVGARGNNGIGVTGVNWRVKLMIIRSNFSTTESNVIAAYAYALRARKKYNATNGREGAFVVATNSSWGLDYGQASDAPIWCAYYDTLGAAGILSVGATANLDINVDVAGDLPTTCGSAYLIGVTNIDRRGWKVQNAGYGAQSIDIGAFGEGVYTCNNAGSYSAFGGTSAAAPHVSGAIGLVYAALCEDYIHLARTQPAQVAEYVRRSVLEGARSSVYMDGITTTGGQLNLNGALLRSLAECPSTGCPPPYEYEILSRTRDSLRLCWRSFSSAQNWALQYRNIEDTLWSLPVQVQADTLLFGNLSACTGIRLRLWSVCADGERGKDSVEWEFYSGGCCVPPTLLHSEGNARGDTAIFSWSAVDGALNYRLQYRAQGDTLWSEIVQADTLCIVAGLSACRAYEWRLNSRCDSSRESSFSALHLLYMPNCTDCAAHAYCVQAGANSQRDYIESLHIVGVDSIYTGNNGGYLFVDTTQIDLYRGGSYIFRLRQGGSDLQYVRIWADWNQDGDFADAGELASEGVLQFVRAGEFAVEVPAAAAFGLTRLRIALRYNAYPLHCEGFAFGEVEDYCVFLQPANGVENLNADTPNAGWRILNSGAGAAQVELLYTGAASESVLSWRIVDVLGRAWARGELIAHQGEVYRIPLPEMGGIRLLCLQTAEGKSWTVKI